MHVHISHVPSLRPTFIHHTRPPFLSTSCNLSIFPASKEKNLFSSSETQCTLMADAYSKETALACLLSLSLSGSSGQRWENLSTRTSPKLSQHSKEGGYSTCISWPSLSEWCRRFCMAGQTWGYHYHRNWPWWAGSIGSGQARGHEMKVSHLTLLQVISESLKENSKRTRQPSLQLSSSDVWVHGCPGTGSVIRIRLWELTVSSRQIFQDCLQELKKRSRDEFQQIELKRVGGTDIYTDVTCLKVSLSMCRSQPLSVPPRDSKTTTTM